MRAKQTTLRPKTAREIAKKLGCTPQTVRNWWALPREQYLANALTQSKPWETLGMSRATWYRRGKPNPTPVETEGVVSDEH